MENSNKNWILIVLIVILVAVGIYYLATRVEWGDNNQDVNTPGEDVAIENQYDGKIVYGTNLEELDEEMLRQDCSLRGGQFETCGDTCAPGAQICTEVCAYTCILPEEGQNGNNSGASFEYDMYENSDLEFTAEIATDMEISEETDNRIEFMYLGPTQTEGTELFDGARIMVSRLQYNNSQSLEDFARNIAEANPEVTEIVENVRLENQYDFATYTFTVEGLGVYKHYTSLIYPGEAFDIIVFVSDQKYQVLADRFLNSFTITDPDRVSTEIEGLIEVSSPKLGQTISSSPLEIEGMASGTWFFEASFSAVLTDWDGLIIGNAVVQTSEDWMTEEMIPFSASIEFDDSVDRFSPRATLILQKANPSGLPENANALEFPVYIE